MGRARARRIPAQLVEDEDYQLRHERVAGIDIAKAKARASSPELKKIMTDAGVDSPPTVRWYKLIK